MDFNSGQKVVETFFKLVYNFTVILLVGTFFFMLAHCSLTRSHTSTYEPLSLLVVIDLFEFILKIVTVTVVNLSTVVKQILPSLCL